MKFRYERKYVEQNGTGPPEDISRAEIKDRLIDWVLDTEVAIIDLETHPGVWTRLTGFAFYRAVLKGDSDG